MNPNIVDDAFELSKPEIKDVKLEIAYSFLNIKAFEIIASLMNL